MLPKIQKPLPAERKGWFLSVLLILNDLNYSLPGPITGNPYIPMTAGRPVTLYIMTATAGCCPIPINVYIPATTHFPATINPHMARLRGHGTYYHGCGWTNLYYYLCRRGKRKSNYQGCGYNDTVDILFHTMNFFCFTIHFPLFGGPLKTKV